MAQKTQENFAGQTCFIGLDVHKKQWTVAIRTQGILVQRLSMNPSPKALKRFLERTYPGGTYQRVYEAGFCGLWIHQQLLEQGIANIVVHPPDVPTSASRCRLTGSYRSLPLLCRKKNATGKKKPC